MKKYSRTVPAWKRKYDELYEAAGNRIPDGKTTNGYNKEFSEEYGVPFGTVNSHYYSKGNFIPIPKVVKDLPEWKDQIQKDIAAGNIPLVAKPYIQRVAAAFEVKFSTVNTFYYKTIKEEATKEEVKQLKEELKEQIKEPEQPVIPEPIPEPVPEPIPEKPQLHPGYTYRRGSVIQVKVKRVEAAFAIVETLDEHKLPGIIHISQVSNNFISDIYKWFKIGQELSAQVMEYTELDGGRLVLSTRNLAFGAYSWKQKPPRADFQEQLNQVAEKLFKEEEMKTVTQFAATIERNEPNMEQEWKQAKPFIESMIGPVTEAAETEMRKIMKESGVFAFTMSLMGKKDNFTPDIGLMLAQSIKKDLYEKIPHDMVLPR